MRTATLTRILHSRGFALVFAALVLLGAWLYFAAGDVIPLRGERGFALPSPNEWLPGGWAGFGTAMAANAAIVVVAALLCKVFNILRSMTALYIALFGAMQLATPGLMDQFYSGPLLALAAATGLYLLFGRYRSPMASGHVFLVFMLLSGLTAAQYCFALFIPAFLTVCAQMRIMNGRTLVAAGAGMVTPWWILFGFGIITPADFHMPEFRYVFDGVFDPGMGLTLGTLAFTVLLLLLSIVLNLFKTIAYNARSRAINGALTVVAAFAVMGVCLDFNNIFAYVPLLNLCAALQAAHYFSTHRADRSCYLIMAVLAVYVILFIWQTQI